MIARFLIVFCVYCGLAMPANAQKAMSDNGFPLQAIRIDTQAGETLSLIVELAKTSRHRTKGLMYREALTDSEGMLFMWPNLALRQFWMKNTFLPLDILFFDDTGTLVHIAANQEPMSERLISSLVPVKYVLEIEAGGAKRKKIAIGDRFNPLPAD